MFYISPIFIFHEDPVHLYGESKNPVIMPPRGYHQNFVSFIYLCYDKIKGLYFLETNEVPVDIDGEFTAKFVFELEARHGCYDMGKFMSSIKNNEELSNLPTDVFARWISINSDHLTHLPKTIWE